MALKINTINGDSCIIIMQSKARKYYFKQLDGFKKEVGREAILKTENLKDAYIFHGSEAATKTADKIMACIKNTNPGSDNELKINFYYSECIEILEKKLNGFTAGTEKLLKTITERYEKSQEQTEKTFQLFAVYFRFNGEYYFHSTDKDGSNSIVKYLEDAFIFGREQQADAKIKELSERFGYSYSNYTKIKLNAKQQK